MEPARAAGTDDEDAEAVGIVAVLEHVIEPDLPLPGIGVLVRPNPLGAVVEFHEEVELRPSGVWSSKTESG